jgi:hypothetical protein
VTQSSIYLRSAFVPLFQYCRKPQPCHTFDRNLDIIIVLLHLSVRPSSRVLQEIHHDSPSLLQGRIVNPLTPFRRRQTFIFHSSHSYALVIYLVIYIQFLYMIYLLNMPVPCLRAGLSSLCAMDLCYSIGLVLWE